VIVIHFRCCTEGRDTRAAQYLALERIITDAKRSRDRITVMGDVNATEDGDRTDLARLAAATGLVWASEPLACTAFWSRDDGCPRSRLDHVLTWGPPASVVAAGGCATDGCDWQASCPLYADEVSDHCPVVVEF
jgi:endonuclease/exonuclease/phosphatase family metal-dependent hydrolase